MENNDRTLKELGTLDVYPQLELAQTYELKFGLIHLLPKFHGLVGEDPHKHLKEFHVAIRDTRGLYQNEGISILIGRGCEGLVVSIADSLQHLGRHEVHFFPTSRTATFSKEICGIRQHSRETLHEYWERFNKLCATCSHHQIREELLIQYYYEGALMDKMPTAARHLISNMASNTQQFGIKGADRP
ncbi:hypothetical protein CR513_53059, partial [Mucuna pruriens]